MRVLNLYGVYCLWRVNNAKKKSIHRVGYAVYVVRF